MALDPENSAIVKTLHHHHHHPVRDGVTVGKSGQVNWEVFLNGNSERISARPAKAVDSENSAVVKTLHHPMRDGVTVGKKRPGYWEVFLNGNSERISASRTDRDMRIDQSGAKSLPPQRRLLKKSR
jgi:hypothetical protein